MSGLLFLGVLVAVIVVFVLVYDSFRYLASNPTFHFEGTLDL